MAKAAKKKPKKSEQSKEEGNDNVGYKILHALHACLSSSAVLECLYWAMSSSSVTVPKVRKKKRKEKKAKDVVYETVHCVWCSSVCAP